MDATPGRAHRSSTGRRRARLAVRGIVAMLLVIVLALTALTYLGVVGVHVVSSSSMQPSLRVGDMLLTRTVSADDAEIGDIVTLRHPDGQLVTHRVLENQPDPESEGRLIWMQGDDNEVADPLPYPAETVDSTIIRIPLVGGLLHRASRPPASYVAITSLALLVIASLLPRRRKP